MRSFGRGIKHLLLAVIWLLALVCIAEVALRARHWYTRSHPDPHSDRPIAEVLPSSETYQQLRPLVRPRAGTSGGDLRTNSFGLRGAEPAVPKPVGVFRVICLGDDTTLALHLPESDTYCERLAARLQEHTPLTVEVVNGGLPGGCPLTELLLLRHRLMGLQPDLVLLHVDPSDIQDDRQVRPFTFLDKDGIPLAAIHPRLRKSDTPDLVALSHEFLLLEWARDRLIAEWQVDAAPSTDEWDAVGWEMAAEQALSPLPILKSVVAGAYCELIVTSVGDPLRGNLGPVAAGNPSIVQTAGEREPARRLDLAEYARTHGLLYLNAADRLQDRQLEAVTYRVESAAEHDFYAAAQAEFIVQHVPGVWTTGGDTDAPPPLPDFARTPRE